MMELRWTFMCTLGQKTRHLVVLAKEGDQSALNQLYSVYGERIRWMVRFRMGAELRSKLESMDLVQETLIRALGGLDDFTYTSEGEFVRWLSKIAENELRGSLRKLRADKRDVRKEVHLDDDAPTRIHLITLCDFFPRGAHVPTGLAARDEGPVRRGHGAPIPALYELAGQKDELWDGFAAVRQEAHKHVLVLFPRDKADL